MQCVVTLKNSDVSLRRCMSQAMVVHTFHLSTWEALQEVYRARSRTAKFKQRNPVLKNKQKITTTNN